MPGSTRQNNNLHKSMEDPYHVKSAALPAKKVTEQTDYNVELSKPIKSKITNSSINKSQNLSSLYTATKGKDVYSDPTEDTLQRIRKGAYSRVTQSQI